LSREGSILVGKEKVDKGKGNLVRQGCPSPTRDFEGGKTRLKVTTRESRNRSQGSRKGGKELRQSPRKKRMKVKSKREKLRKGKKGGKRFLLLEIRGKFQKKERQIGGNASGDKRG